MLAALGAGAHELEAVEGPQARSAVNTAARRYIESRLADPRLDVDMVAHAVGCSRAGLYRCFAEQGEGIYETIREMRLTRLCQLLENPVLGIADAAARCGFSDPRALQRLFRSRHG